MRILHRRLQSTAGPAPHFSGDIQVELVALGEVNVETEVIKVIFSPGAHTDWHMHPKGQILHVVEGVGFVQERGGLVQKVESGDTIIAEPGTWHWHGATPDGRMAHYAIYPKSEVQHGELVSDQEYAEVILRSLS